MVRLFDPKHFVMLSDGTKVHPYRSIVRDGICCWGDAIPVYHTIREDRQMQIVKTAHRIEAIAAAIDRNLAITPDSWDGNTVSDTLEFTVDDSDYEGIDAHEICERVKPVLGSFEKLFAIGTRFNYRRS
jgi:hypothetical protein